MPRLSDQLWTARRRHVLDSAFRCFARSGFHATTIDDVVAESGWSSSVVYRYVHSKDELITASVDETLGAFADMVEDLMSRDPVPSPREAVQAVVDVMDDAKNDRSYSLSGLVIQTWAEALRTPVIGDQARAALDQGRARLTTLARRWKRLGYLPDAMTAGDAASTLSLMISGIVVDTTHLGGTSTRGALRRMRLFEV